MRERALGTIKFFAGLIIITVIIAIPHNLFGIDVLSFFSIFSFLLLGFLVFYKWIKIYYVLLTINCALVPLISLEYFYSKMELGPELWETVINTNLHEVSELVSKDIGWLLLSTFLLGIISWQVCKRFFPSKLNFKLSLPIFGIGLLGVLLCGVYNTVYVEGGYWYYGFKKLHPLTYPGNLVYALIQRQKTKKWDVQREAFRFNIKSKDASLETRKVVVLVIGETGRADHYSINGYGRSTTPLLEQQAHLYSFTDMTAPASMTILSLPFIMTATDTHNRQSHYQMKGILDAFKEAGFSTAYITNQDESRKDPYKMREFHYENADFFYSCDEYFDTGYYAKVKYDERLFPAFRQFLNEHSTQNLFVILHLSGSHWNYKVRYPAKFAMYNAHSKKVVKNRFNYDTEIAEYDNSILYSDYILNNVIQDLKNIKGEATMIYTSDHGENLKDDDRQLIFHSPDANRYTLHIPYFVWINEELVSKHPQYDSILKAHKNYPLMTSEVTMYTAFDLADLFYPKEEKTQRSNSLLSKELIRSDQPFYTPTKSNVKYTDLLK